MPRILRVGDPSPDAWPAAVTRAVALGLDTLLLPSAGWTPELPTAARQAGIALMADIHVDRVPVRELDAGAPFTRLLAGNLDPRTPPRPADGAVAALGTQTDLEALGAWWGCRLAKSRAAGLAGVRLLGLGRLPGSGLPPFLASLRQAAPGLLLFAWTPGLPPPTLDGIGAGAVDLVASSLPAWDGKADWLRTELATLRRIAPVVCDAGDSHDRRALAAILAEGWMLDDDASAGDDHDLAVLAARRSGGFASLPYARMVSPPGHPVIAVLRTDTPDPRRARRGALAVTAIWPGGSLVAGELLTETGADFLPFRSEATGVTLRSGTVLEPRPGSLDLFLAESRPATAVTALTASSAQSAGAVPRVAIEAPAPAVDGGRFPARQTVGSTVTVTADIITDGHDKLGAAMRWRAPGQPHWTEAEMRPLGNDVWTAGFPLEQLGVHHYVVEAWRDAYATFCDELEKKDRAGVAVALELIEGEALVRAHAAAAPASLRQQLDDVAARVAKAGADGKRDLLLDGATRSLMRAADPRPHRVETTEIPVQAERTAAGFASWYEVFPRSMSDDPKRHGTFRDVVRHLPRVAGMGFDVLYFPPFHPIGRTNRKGRNNTLTPGPDDPGSPYAIGSEAGGHDALHPELGTLEDFEHLRGEAARHGIELAMDFAIQCSPDHPWLQAHPGWFSWRPDGTIRYAENPPKRYEDIVNVDFYAKDAVPDLWLALANAVMFWAGRGIRLFRVDNPHTKPLPFWEWLIGEVQARFPDAVFLAEAFTRPKVMYRLAKVGFSQSYTYFTWRNAKWEFEQYLTELADGPARHFFRPHFFVNTPDINPVPLQTAPRSGFLTRAALAATLSGLWGVYNGFELCDATPVPGKEEYLDSEKYEIRAMPWSRPGNIEREIGQLNAIRRANPALHTHLGITFLRADNDQVLLFEKATPDRGNVVLVAINLDLHTPQSSRIDLPFWRWKTQPSALVATDLVTGREERWTERSRDVALTGAQPYAIWRISPAEA